MPIEITKRGEIPDPKYKATCFKCKTEIQFVKSDSKRQEVPYSDDPRERSYNFVNCPVCQEVIADMAWREVK